MKKFLSLVLALVMTMSLVTISAGAADYEDDSKITYKEAVDVVSALKIVGGYADGTFNPSATLTRGAASKIICNLILGPTTASALAADAAPFKDVPADSTFAGYIAYCAKQGIISGYADGTFRPGNTLTGYAFMKMLLGALGYDAALEGYTGNNWSIAVAKQAIAIGLEDGLAEEFNGVKPVTREEACLYALNTITAAVVSYDDKGTNITIGDTTINTGASQAEKTTVGDTSKLDAVGDGDYLQFGEKYFKDLKASTDNDAFGRPAVKWTLKAQEIDTYAKTPALTYVESVKGGDIYKDLGKPSVDSVTVYTNGTYNSASPATSDNTVFNVKKDNALKIGGNGIVVEVYTADADDDNKDEITVVAISNFAEKVQTVTPARGDNKRYVTLENGKKFETKEFDVDDIVVYTEAWKAAADSSVKSMVLAEKVADVDVDKINYTKSTFTDGTTTYDFAAHYAGDTLATDSKFDVYTDVNGNVVYIEETAASVAKYAVVLATRSANWTDGKSEIRLLLADGTEVEAKCENIAGLAFMDVVSYTVDKDGVYTCTELTIGGGRAVAIPSAGAGTNEVTTGVAKLGTSGKYANADTVFVVAKTDNPLSPTKFDDVKVYTGIKNVPDVNVTGATVAATYFKTSATMADLVLLVDATTADDDVVFLSSKGYAKITNRDGNDYYQFKAVVNGEITTLDIDATEAFTKLNTNNNDKWDAPAFMLTNRVMNSKDIATSITEAGPSAAGVGDGYYVDVVATSFRKDTVKIGAVSYTVDDDVTVYVLDNNGDFTAAGASALAAYEKVLYRVKDGAIVTALVYTDLDTATSPWVG